MTDLSDARTPVPASAGEMAQPRTVAVVPLGLDDGYAVTKIALPDGRLIAIPSRARIGQAGVTWLRAAEQRIFEYETGGVVYAAGAVDGESTQFAEYPVSNLNRVILQHALQQAGLAGQAVQMVSGLPVAAFYRADGQPRTAAIQQKRDSLTLPVVPRWRSPPHNPPPEKVSVEFHQVIPEALAAWYDHVIVTQDDGVTLDADRLNAPVAVIDIGGRTTDYVVVQNQGIVHAASGSLEEGMLKVTALVAAGIEVQFAVEGLGEQCLARAVDGHRLRLHGRDHDIAPLVRAAKRELVERLYAETRRKLGKGAELDRILFVGGGSAALATDIAHWFPNQQLAENAAFANARGMLKYLQFVYDDAAL